MVEYIFSAVKGLCAEAPVVVVGSGAEQVKAKLGDKARFCAAGTAIGNSTCGGLRERTAEGQVDAVLWPTPIFR